MVESALKDYPNADVSVSIIWIPMLGNDDEAAARKASRMFDDRRVHQFWDAKKRGGIALSRDVFPRWISDAAKALPADHRLADTLNSRAELPPEKRPLWDIALFYDKGIEWTDGPPAPNGWAKQIAYFGLQDNGTSGLFWRNSFGEVPAASDWLVEISHGMKALVGTPTAAHRASDGE